MVLALKVSFFVIVSSVESMLYFREYSRARKLLCIGARRRKAGKSLFIGAYMTNFPFICPTSRRKEQKMNFDLPRKENILSTLEVWTLVSEKNVSKN